VDQALHPHHALVAPLARLRLREVPGPQRDGPDLAGREEDLPRVKELRAVLKNRKRNRRSFMPAVA